MYGVALSSSIQFFIRFLILLVCCLYDEELQECEISIMHEDSWIDLDKMFTVGWQNFMVKVMGVWAFDVFTQIAAFTGPTDTAA